MNYVLLWPLVFVNTSGRSNLWLFVHSFVAWSYRNYWSMSIHYTAHLWL